MYVHLVNLGFIYIFVSEHMQHLDATFSRKAKSKKWLQDEHNRTFIAWLDDRVSPIFIYHSRIHGGVEFELKY